jgi:hypothetical protein
VRNQWLWRGAAAIGCAALALGPLPPASAAPAAPAAAFSLTVSPTRLVIGAGQLATDQRFQVINRGSATVDVVVEKANFVPAENGSLRFTPAAPYSASTWIVASPGKVRLGPGARADVRVRIAVPEAPEPGEHQAALIFRVPASDTGGGNIRLTRGIGTPVYITVPGPTDDTAVVTDLRAPGFSWRGPITFSAAVQDTGTVHRDFRDTERLPVQVGGGQVLFPDFTVLRGATRRVDTVWSHPPLFCRCHATVSIAGRDGTVTERRVDVTIVPVHLIAGVLGAALLLLLFIAVRRHRARRAARAQATT